MKTKQCYLLKLLGKIALEMCVNETLIFLDPKEDL